MENQLLPPSIETRALKFMEEGKDPIEAVKLAIEQENNTIWLCMGVDMKTGSHRPDIAKEITGHICTRVYNRLKNTKTP